MKRHTPSATLAPNEIDGLLSLEAHALGEAHDRFYPAVYRYARFRLGDDQQAEDLASEVFMRLIEAVQQGKGPRRSLQGWLMATAANLAADHFRSRYRHPVDELAEELPADAPQPEELASRAEVGEHLRQALAGLTPDQQHVIALRFGAGFSLEQTAANLGKDPNAVKALQFRALGTLRRRMGDHPA